MMAWRWPAKSTVVGARKDERIPSRAGEGTRNPWVVEEDDRLLHSSVAAVLRGKGSR